MKFNIFGVFASVSLACSIGAAATPFVNHNNAGIENRDLLSLSKTNTPKLGAGAALDIINALQKRLDPHEKKLNDIAHGITAKSSNKERNHAIASAKTNLTALSKAVYEAIDEISTKAREKKETNSDIMDQKSGGSGGARVQALADALNNLLIKASSTVNTLVASLGLTGLLSFLPPVTASLSGLVVALIPVVDSLLPILNVILDGVVTGLSGLLCALIL